jgi:hypothetical protein
MFKVWPYLYLALIPPYLALMLPAIPPKIMNSPSGTGSFGDTLTLLWSWWCQNGFIFPKAHFEFQRSIQTWFEKTTYYWSMESEIKKHGGFRCSSIPLVLAYELFDHWPNWVFKNARMSIFTVFSTIFQFWSVPDVTFLEPAMSKLTIWSLFNNDIKLNNKPLLCNPQVIKPITSKKL